MNPKFHVVAIASLAVCVLEVPQAKAQAVGTVYTGIAVYTAGCTGGPTFVQYEPAKIVKSSNGNVTIKMLQESASQPPSAPVSVPGDGNLIFLIKPPTSGAQPNQFYQYLFTAGSQRAPTLSSGKLALEPGTDGVTGLPNLGFQFSTSFPSGAQTCTLSYDGGAVAFQPGL